MLTEIAPRLMTEAFNYNATHPLEADQSYWGYRTPCGTKACQAGRIAMIHDPSLRPPEITVEQAEHRNFKLWFVNGVNVELHVRNLLGLTPGQAGSLFNAVASLGELRAAVRALIISNGEVNHHELDRVMRDQDMGWLPEGGPVLPEPELVPITGCDHETVGR